MHPQIEALFDEAENRYLKAEELSLMSEYVGSLPARMDTYRMVRDRELEVMQWVADQLQTAMPQENMETLERCIKNALLVLRYCAMGMLLNNDSFVKEKLQGWFTGMIKVYNTQEVDITLYRLLNQRLSQTINPQQLELLAPQLRVAETLLLQDAIVPVSV
jgi:hypothetical protein